jgi:biotin synthesis protein BioG
MQAFWTRRSGNGRVLLFLNGCGMDARILGHAALPEAWDVLTLFNYADMSVPAEVHECMESGATVFLAGWSMGVWAAGALAPYAGRVTGSAAINGTGMPIHDRYGIPPAIYRATVESFSLTNRLSFYRRMCGRQEDLQRFLMSAPERSVADQHAELSALEKHVPGQTVADLFPFRRAIVGSQDKIIPAANQERFWAEHGGCRLVDMPHFPFFHLSWKEIIEDAAGN